MQLVFLLFNEAEFALAAEAVVVDLIVSALEIEDLVGRRRDMREQQRIAVCSVSGIPVPHVLEIFVFSFETCDLAGMRVDLQDRRLIFQCIDHRKK